MTIPVNSDAARASQAPAETGQPEGSQPSQRTVVRERVLAALEAQLAQELHTSPSIAGEEAEEIQPQRDAAQQQPAPSARPRAAAAESVAPRPLRRVVRRKAPVARRGRPQEDPSKPAETADGKRMEDLLRELRRLSAAEPAPARDPVRLKPARENHVSRPDPIVRLQQDDEFARALADLDDGRAPEFLGRPAPVREPEMPRAMHLRQGLRDARAPLPVPPWADRPSPIARAMRVAAAIFSVLALVGVSALVVVLTMGERPAMQAATVAAPGLGRGADRAENNNPSPVSSQRDDAPAVTGAIGSKRDASRIASEAAAAARAAGTVRSAAEPAPMGGPFVAARPAEAPAAPNALVEPGASAPRTPEPVRFSAAPSIPAQTRTAAAETGSGAGGSEVDAARATRSAAVTQHVNLRAEPKNEAAVVVVVPQGRDVGIVNCDQWCEVVYDGRKGFIHKRFVAGQ